MRNPKVGTALVIAGFALPVVAFVGAHAAMAVIASREPAPNQGAMVVAFALFVWSIVLAPILIAVGGLVLARSGREK